MSIMKRTGKEDAVSPVVGVMLMLVITIIIAAVVAAFSSGLISTSEPADTAFLSLESYTMGTVNQNGDPAATYKDGWYDYGVTDYGEWGVFANSNYGPYTMVFKHKGGEKLFIDNLKLIVTYNGASYTTPLKDITSAKEWKAGDKITLKAPLNDGTDLKYGLGRQNMGPGSGANSFTWQIADANNNILAKGTESTKLFDYGMTAALNVTSLVEDAPAPALITVNAPTYPDDEPVTITLSATLTASPSISSPKITDGRYTWEGTLTGSAAGDETVTVEVGMFKQTFTITVTAAPEP